jgi:antitoxin component YwqK of YwqJK toxin-antitoxin module
MRITAMFLSLFLWSAHSFAQALIPMHFSLEDDNVLLNENDSVRYYQQLADTTKIVCINEDASSYKLLNKARKLITDGYFTAEGDKYLQEGKWTQRYDNGKVKVTGYYSKNKPVGAWQECYPTGNPKSIYSYAIINDNGVISTCISGTWQEFYPDGKMKASGFYSATAIKVSDTLIIEDPITDTKVSKIMIHSDYKPEKTGHWEYFKQTGELDKKEDL